VGPRADLYDVKKRKFLTLPGLEPKPLGCPIYVPSEQLPDQLQTQHSIDTGNYYGRTQESQREIRGKQRRKNINIEKANKQTKMRSVVTRT
jgi:hypothetical protein